MIDAIKSMLGMDDEVAISRLRRNPAGNAQLVIALTELMAEVFRIKAERDVLRAENQRLLGMLEATSNIRARCTGGEG